MKMDFSKVLAFVKGNPTLVAAVGDIVIKGALADPKLIPDAIALSQGGDPAAFLHAHHGIVTDVAQAAWGEVRANPQLIVDAIGALVPAS